MENLKQDLIKTLVDLKQNHHVIGVKAEFEDEGASLEEIKLLNNLATEAELQLTIKIGGCGALNDLNSIKNLNLKSIVAPMIESPYALRKFVESFNSVFEQPHKTDMYINIETITGVEHFDLIAESDYFKNLTGVVVGRFDLAKSIGLSCPDCNGSTILNLIKPIAEKTYTKNKNFTIGGGVNQTSLEFFNHIFKYLNMFETRKIIFNAKECIKNNDFEAINKAINFEIQWINFKRQFFETDSEKDKTRIEKLKARQEKVFSKAN